MTNKRTVTLFVGIWVVLTFLSVSFSQNNGQVGFRIEIQDVIPPEYSNFNSTTLAVSELNENVTFSANWTDKYALDSWIFSWDMSGIYQNVSFGNFTSDTWSNATLNVTNKYVEGRSINCLFFANDTSNNWNSTSLITLNAINQNPMYNNLAQQNDSLGAGEYNTLSADFTDNFNLDRVFLWMKNDTEWYVENVTVIDNKTYSYNYSYATTGLLPSTIVYWYLFANDSAGNGNTTVTKSFSIT